MRRFDVMSTLPENELDLEKLFLPAWAQQEPSAAKYAHYEGEQERPDRREGRRGPRPPRREGFGGGNRPGFRPGGDRRGRPGEGQDAGKDRRDRSARGPRGERPERRELPPPLPQLDAMLVPEDKGVESLARQIKMTGRAYPLFDIAQLILQRPERHYVVLNVRKNAEGKPIQPLFVCALDDSLWLSEDEVVAHVLQKHFTTFYQPERTATEPPKGKYTFVAQCGISGVVLGPPNHHDYQNRLRKLHAERFSRMPFDVYKSRVKIVRDEEVVKKWVEDQSWKTDYVCLNLPEAVRLGNMEAVEKHFRETHKENIIKSVESHKMTGTAARSIRSPDLARLARTVTEDQRRFPLQIATVLSQQFASHGLQFFKVNKSITHVAVARPHYLDLALTPVSDGVKRIVDYINANPKSTRRRLVEALAPSPAPAPVPALPAAPETAEPGTPAPAAETPAPAAAPADVPTPEQTVVISDLHWLIHQGHVIEFANGILESAKKPLPKPPKPEKPKAAETPAAPGAAAATAPEGAQAATEAAPSASSEAGLPTPDEPAPAAPVLDALQTSGEPPAATVASDPGEPAAAAAEAIAPSAPAEQESEAAKNPDSEPSPTAAQPAS